MIAFACPSCGAEIPFRSSFSVYAVCSYCGSTVVRQDRDVTQIGQVADLPAEMTPLQIGTDLDWRGTRYTLAGRKRVAWADGAWNEWFMVAGDKTGWLAEAQGFFAVAFPHPIEAAALPAGALPRLGATVAIDDSPYRVSDIKQATCLGSEGELPVRAPRGRKATYVDMMDEQGGFAGIEDSADGRLLFIGENTDFDLLKFRNLRKVEGWKPPATPRGPQDPLAAS